MKFFRYSPVFALLALSANLLCAQPSAVASFYDTGSSDAIRIGDELYAALPAEHQREIYAHPVAVERNAMPSIKTVEYPNNLAPLRMVFISTGFLDLINNVAHARAIDRIQPGYFQNYLSILANESGQRSLSELPNISDPRFWTLDVMNDQKSSFNQMVGTAIAIELSHHYLGHFRKYVSRLGEGEKLPINELLTPDEWDDSLQHGVRNALDSGYGVDGIKLLYDTLNQLPKRPYWTAYFMPKTWNLDGVMAEVQGIEDDFFSGN